MNNKTKKLIASIATIIIFVIGGYFYLTAPEEGKDETGVDAGYEVEDNDNSHMTDYNADEATTVHEDEFAVTEATVEDESNVDEDGIQDYEVTYEFRKKQYLDEHFEKHGSEFDYETAEEYLEGANRVINDPNSLYKTEAEDGDHIYYLESTNEFVVVSTDGYIRTYFKPSAGIDYFNRQ